MNLETRKSQSSSQKDVPDDETANSSEKGLKRSEFLEFIKKHPVLYDVHHPEFNRKDSINNCWLQISSETGIDGLFLLTISIYKLNKLCFFPFLAYELRMKFNVLKWYYRQKLQKKNFRGKEEMKFLEESISVSSKYKPEKSFKKWKEGEIEELLKLVKKHPVIFDENLSGSNKFSETKKEAWSKISSEMNINCMFFKFILLGIFF